MAKANVEGNAKTEAKENMAKKDKRHGQRERGKEGQGQWPKRTRPGTPKPKVEANIAGNARTGGRGNVAKKAKDKGQENATGNAKTERQENAAGKARAKGRRTLQ